MIRDIIVIKGNITEIVVDAVVAPATRMLENGKSPVTNNIFAAAGSGLIDECRFCAPCAQNTAMVTGSHNLNCKIIIHAVATQPQAEFEQPLRDVVKHCLELAHLEGSRSIAFPLLGLNLGIPLDGVIKQSINAIEESEHHIATIIFVVGTDYQLDQFIASFRKESEKPKKSRLSAFAESVKKRLSKPGKN